MSRLFAFASAVFAALSVLTAPVAAQMDPDIRQALVSGDIAGLQAAIAGGADVDAAAEEGLEETPLMLAASIPDPSFVTVLVNAGAEVYTQDAFGDSAVNWAAYYGHFDVLAVFAQVGADFTLTGHGNARQILMRRGHQRALEAVTQHLGLAPQRAVEEIGVDGALAAGAPEMLEPYLEWEGLAEARERTGRPVIQTAARNNRGEVVQVLVDAGYPVDATDEIGFTGLMEAAREGAPLAVEAFIAAGADVDHVAEPSGLSMTPMHLAAIGGSPQVITALIEAGANLDGQDTDGATPLMWAVAEGQRTAIIFLIEAGADVDIESNQGFTFRQAAEANGWTDFLAAIAEAEGEAETDD
jgi:ankyrin repeat protein